MSGGLIQTALGGVNLWGTSREDSLFLGRLPCNLFEFRRIR